MIDPILNDAIAEHRSQMRKPVQDAGRTSTFFMFNTIRHDTNFNVATNGPRIGFTAETLARLLVLFPQWDAAVLALEVAGLKSHARLMPVIVGTHEFVFDEVSQSIYSTQIRIEFKKGITIPMRNPATGSELRPGKEASAHEMYRADIERWRDVELITVPRRVAAGLQD